jgi:hypothetical protein
MRSLEHLRLEVERRMLGGERFSDVENVINASELSADEKSALWLLGWSYLHPRAQRREANAHLARLAATDPDQATKRRPRRLRLIG